VSYPAFATHEDVLVSFTKANIVKKLKGRYGFKRFKRDGYKCAIEDAERMYYNVGETKVSNSCYISFLILVLSDTNSAIARQIIKINFI